MSASYWLENLFFSERVESPVPLGWLDPAVIFPRRFERMDESQQRAIACHELLQVARRDWLMNLLEELVLALFWFHPAIWWVVRSIRLSREQVVDGEVVALTGVARIPRFWGPRLVHGPKKDPQTPRPGDPRYPANRQDIWMTTSHCASRSVMFSTCTPCARRM
jgi:hypothetical protein